MEEINQQIRQFILTSPSDQQLTDFINNQLRPNTKPTLKLHQINTKDIKQPTLVYAHLMVQDIRDAYYYISFAMKRPFNPQDPYYLYKYGNQPESEPQDVLNSKAFINVFTDRYTVVGMPIRYQSKWVDQTQGRVNFFQEILVEVDGQANYKLGQTLNMVAMYDPDMKKLYMVRQVDKEEAIQAGLEPNPAQEQLTVEAIEAIRLEVMNQFCGYASQSFSEFLLFSLISPDPFFLACQNDISPLVAEIYPRVAHIQLVHPANHPLFPFKNQEGELKVTDMQMSILPTFVSIDLSQFSKEEKVVVQGTELQNLSALKNFVEEGKTVYKWQIGESHYDHKHRGIIVKASQLITPHFNPKDQRISLEFGSLIMVPEVNKQRYRKYLRKVAEIDPCLEDEDRKLIEKELMDYKQKQKVAAQLEKIMLLSKLHAQSYGRPHITLQDFRKSKALMSCCAE